MVKQILLPLLAVMLFIVLVGLLTQRGGSLSKYMPAASPTGTKTMTVGGKTVHIDVAGSKETRAKGLSGVSSLSNDSGMLFVFDSKAVSPTFWMKDMLIPLDIIWISGDKVVKIDKNVPAPSPGTPDGSLVLYPAGRPIDYVLEVNAGFSDNNNLKVGDQITLPSGP